MTPSDASHAEEDDDAAGGGVVSANGKRTKSSSNDGDAVLRPVKLSRKDLYKPPTVEELNQLKEAESLFHCSLLKMQVKPLHPPPTPPPGGCLQLLHCIGLP